MNAIRNTAAAENLEYANLRRVAECLRSISGDGGRIARQDAATFLDAALDIVDERYGCWSDACKRAEAWERTAKRLAAESGKDPDTLQPDGDE